MLRRAAVRALPLILLSFLAPAALASHTPPPVSVNLVGSLQSEVTGGACGDWDPSCAASGLVSQPNGVYVTQRAVPAGNWEYKIALGSWAENYGSNFLHDGPNIALNLTSPATVRFFYDHKTHYITDDARNTIYTVPGSYGPAIGCPPWAPECLGSLMSDLDGDGRFTFATRAIAPGSYHFKVATDESWANPNYGVGGGAADVPFTVARPGSTVTFSFDSATNVPTVSVVAPAGSSRDGNVEWDGLRHDSRDDAYRTPVGAVEAGTPARLRFRTFHDDVTGVAVRLFDVDANAQRVVPMRRVATDVSCYDRPGRCDFWELELANAEPATLWYRFVVSDGTDVDFYGDDTQALDGGAGAPTDDVRDWSYALTVYEPDFETPDWAKSAFVYQIFPDRFRNGNPGNDPVPGAADKRRASTDARYGYPPNIGDQVLQMRWDELPEGYCRNYATPLDTCLERFPQADGEPREGPRGRDYFGGDLKGVTDKLDYLADLGVTAIYFNPIFDGGSNHGYDTQDYFAIDPYFGTLDHFAKLEREAAKRGIRLILDGVFNHMSSDSPLFDRYHHYAGEGACESTGSPYRAWFYFRAPAGSEPAACAGGLFYDSWFGFDSIPALTKTLPAVQSYFLTGDDSVTRTWLRRGADGWRLDVSGDPSFPAGYWEAFRAAVEAESPDALTISETWQKDSALLRITRGDRLDTTMNYRLRDAVLGLLAPGVFDPKGFGDSGRSITPAEFASRISSIYEDLAPEAAAVLMNLLDSHDTERILWTLTPGAETRAAKEQDASNVAEGKRRLMLASLVQFGVPGAPTVYYGDEVGLTGDDDPDDRRTFPWADLGGSPDLELLAHYKSLAALRKASPALTQGSFRVFHVSDASGTVAFVRQTPGQAAVVALNRGAAPATIDLASVVRGAPTVALAAGGAAVSGSVLTLEPRSGAIVVSNGDFEPPAAPALELVRDGDGVAELAWAAVGGATRYDVYRSPLRGGGYVKANTSPVTGTSFVDIGLRNATQYYYVVRALDAAGNASARSNEVAALPHLTIGWANLQWPPSLTHVVSAVTRTGNVYGQVWIGGATEAPGATPSLRAQLGFGPPSDAPTTATWTWVEAAFNVQAGNNDEFVASLLPEAAGTYHYLYRYSTTDGRDWFYAGLGGPYTGSNAGVLTVDPSADGIAPATPAGLRIVAASPAGIDLAWDPVTGDPSLHGYEVFRDGSRIASTSAASYTDTTVVQGARYAYAVRSVDTSFNRSPPSAAVDAVAQLRTVRLVMNVTVPAPTEDAVGKSVYIAGLLDRLDGNLPQWKPGDVVMTRVDDTHWTITFTGKESTQIAYKYTLGSWDFVEKDAACGEIGDRQLTLSYGGSGTQVVEDTVPNWRNVAPCGN